MTRTIVSLDEVAGLEVLSEICADLKIEITAYGSLVRRIARSLVRPRGRLDLFELSPLLSDIDLKHNGTTEQTPAVREAILGRVPSAECFRWEIFSEEELAEFKADEVHLPIIPAAKLQLGTRARRGITQSWDGMADVFSANYRLIRNGFMGRSTAFQEGRDCELLYALRYLHLLLEEWNSIGSPSDQPGWNAGVEIIKSCRTQRFVMLFQDQSGLRARIRYRLKAMRASALSNDAWESITQESGLSELLTHLDQFGAFGISPISDEIISPEESSLVSSSWLGGDIFRLAQGGGAWLLGIEAAQSWRDSIPKHRPLTELCSNPIPLLEDSNEIVAASPAMRFAHGTAACNRGQEHLHFQVPLDERTGSLCRKFGEQSLGVILLLTANVYEKGGENVLPHSCAVALSGCCFLRSYGSTDSLWTFEKEDFSDPRSLVIRLGTQSNRIAKWLWEQMKEIEPSYVNLSTEEIANSKGVLETLIAALNRAIDWDKLDEESKSAEGLNVSEEIRWFRSTPEEGETARLNRRLLEALFPGELRRVPSVDLLLQVRLDCGYLLNEFPGLVEKAGIDEVRDHSLQIFIVGSP